jgi:Amt family ammonium transporter
VLAWSHAEWALKGNASMLGAASGAVRGLVAITPAAATSADGRAGDRRRAGFACLWGVNGLEESFGADDSLDVFGVHGVGGIVGALLTSMLNSQSLGGPGLVTDLVTASVIQPDRRAGVAPGRSGRRRRHRLVGVGGVHHLQDR